MNYLVNDTGMLGKRKSGCSTTELQDSWELRPLKVLMVKQILLSSIIEYLYSSEENIHVDIGLMEKLT